ncbi:MAG: helix-turn-helix domain-containing protein [Lachnospiraceae bacterium]|nr:helix-turn-helix domain-containing protein [Lachnospiraceae bacterium]
MDQQKIGEFLKNLRKEKNITQEQLGEALGVSGRTVSRWETSRNLPDISLLAEIAEFYDVSIVEIIDGERKSENMKDETKKVVESMTDYAEAEQENRLKEIRKMSISGAIAAVVYLILDTIGIPEGNTVLSNISTYCLTLIFVCVILTPLLATGLIEKMRWRKKVESGLKGLPKPVAWLIIVLAAFAVAILIKYILAAFFPAL